MYGISVYSCDFSDSMIKWDSGLLLRIGSKDLKKLFQYGGLFCISNLFRGNINWIWFLIEYAIAVKIWNNWFPFNKAIWSSSFVLVTAGWASSILGVLYYVLDVKKKRIATIFKYVGANAIVIYVASSFITETFYLLSIGNTSIHGWLYATFFTPVIAIPKLASLMYAVVVVLFYLFVGYMLYRKKIFVKV